MKGFCWWKEASRTWRVANYPQAGYNPDPNRANCPSSHSLPWPGWSSLSLTFPTRLLGESLLSSHFGVWGVWGGVIRASDKQFQSSQGLLWAGKGKGTSRCDEPVPLWAIMKYLQRALGWQNSWGKFEASFTLWPFRNSASSSSQKGLSAVLLLCDRPEENWAVLLILFHLCSLKLGFIIHI